ncbi:efflux RND transporter periplasmic adaptor subunit [bacterium]|nr:efflux RND transporter periplasmic adaptor subunit [bacterium]
MTIRRSAFLKLLLAAAVLGGGYYWWVWQSREPAEARYKTYTVTKETIVQSVAANGTLNPVILVSVGTQVSGTVKKLYVDFNDKVQKGQVLMELDPSLFSAQVKASEANLKNARSMLALAEANDKRMRPLFKKGYISVQQMDETTQTLQAAHAQVDLAVAQLEKDRTNLRYSVIRSPVSGVVVDRTVDIGQTVAASFQTPTLFKIAQDLSKMQIDANFAEADIGGIRIGQKVEFTVDTFAGRTFEGVVRQIRLNATTQQNVVTYDVVVAVNNPDKILLPGMTAYANVILAVRKDVIAVPLSAFRFRPSEDEKAKGQSRKTKNQKPVIYLLRNGKLEPIEIQEGINNNKMVEVLSGNLKEGDKVVIEENRGSGGSKSGESSMRVRMF